MRRPNRPKPDINVTPLVDVVLVMLIIFMVVLPQMQAGANVNVPGARNPDRKTDLAQPPVTLSITAKGSLYLEKTAVAREELVTLLRDRHLRSPASKLFLKGDREAPYGLVRAVFKDAQGLGFPGVALQVGDLRPGEGT